MDTKILFRKDFDNESEFKIAQNVWGKDNVLTQRCELGFTEWDHNKKTVIICRYSCLPYYRELEKDCFLLAATELINSSKQHEYVASFDYYEDIRDYTFPSWKEHEYAYSGYNGPVVVKGLTNSRKHQWDTHMFAKDRRQALEIASELANDPLIGPQGLVYRKYIPLKTYEKSTYGGLPITNEWRFFYYRSTCLSCGYYWTQAPEDVIKNAKIPTEAITFANQVAKIISQHINFFALDIGETDNGEWIVIEVGDAQMAGLSMNDPKLLYTNLKILAR